MKTKPMGMIGDSYLLDSYPFKHKELISTILFTGKNKYTYKIRNVLSLKLSNNLLLPIKFDFSKLVN